MIRSLGNIGAHVFLPIELSHRSRDKVTVDKP